MDGIAVGQPIHGPPWRKNYSKSKESSGEIPSLCVYETH